MQGDRQIILSFDVEGPTQNEDSFPEYSAEALRRVLMLLDKYHLEGIFFITGTVCEKLIDYPDIVKMLECHEVGYHSSSHSVKPRIFEYTDVKHYKDAIEISLLRETSYIDPLNGEMKGKGGILKLREIFPNKQINCFRAPFLCWSPPHIEAIRDLGFKFDFSADISHKPVNHHGITFFPHPIVIDKMSQKVALVVDGDKRILPRLLLSKIFSEEATVLLLHPSKIMENREHSIQIKVKSQKEIELKLAALEMFCRGLSLLRNLGLTNITPFVKKRHHVLPSIEVDAKRLYTGNALICEKLFGYKPKYMFSHFLRFLGMM
jgi:hypothetical protein